MRTLVYLPLLACLGLGCGSETPAEPTKGDKTQQTSTGEPAPIPDLDHEALAKQIVAWLDEGEHAKVRGLFDQAMTTALPSDFAVEATWTGIETQFGELEEVLATTLQPTAPYMVVLVTCRFANSPMDVRVVFDQDKRLAGLQVTASQNPDAYGERPQTPKEPFPYRAEEVSYTNPRAKITIGGTLTLPEGPGPHPAVLLITGSGAQDRDETLFGHKPFLVIADHLTRKGFAVLRVDDRGVGKTGGDPTTSTVEDHATDAEAGIAFLETRPEIDRARIGLIGHSEGGVVAPMVAARSSNVAFIVSLAGPGVSGAVLNPMQVRALLEAGNAPKDVVDEIVAGQEALMKSLLANAPEEELRDAVKALAKVAVKLNPGADPDDVEAQKAVGQQMVPLLSPWFRSWVALDPAIYLAQVSVPILVMIGDKDLQVPAGPNLEAAKSALATNPKARMERLAGLNHLFQTAKIGTIDEYVTLSETFSPAALELMTTWLLETTKT